MKRLLILIAMLVVLAGGLGACGSSGKSTAATAPSSQAVSTGASDTASAADPTLCKFVPNLDGIKSSLGSLTGKIKDGTATSGDVDGTSNLFDQLKNGTGFTPPANASLPGLG